MARAAATPLGAARALALPLCALALARRPAVAAARARRRLLPQPRRAGSWSTRSRRPASTSCSATAAWCRSATPPSSASAPTPPAIMISEGVRRAARCTCSRRWPSRRWPRCVIGAISLRTRGVYFIMITLAFAQMLFYLANSVKGYGGDEGLNIRARSLLGLGLDLKDPTRVLLRRARPCSRATLRGAGALRAARASAAPCSRMRDDDVRAEALGFPTYRYKLVVFVVAGALGGIAGALSVNQQGYVSPNAAALDAVGHADGDGDPRRRRHASGAASLGAAALLLLQEVLVGVHRALGVLDRLGAARGGAVRAPAASAGVAGARRRWRGDAATPRRCSTCSGLEQALRRRGRHRRRRPAGARRRGPCADRPQRRRQDDAGGAARRPARAATAAASSSTARDITRLSPHQRARRGLVRSFQITRLFRSFSVLDNVALAVQARQRLAACRRWRPVARETGAVRARARGAATSSASPPRQRSRIDAALARRAARARSRPGAGEPAAPGAARRADGRHGPRRVGAHGSADRRPARTQRRVLLIEHDVDAVFRLADRVSVLVSGADHRQRRARRRCAATRR